MNSINLVLSNRCQAACVWCPSTRGTSQKLDMPLELVEKIFQEVIQDDFPYTIKSIRLSENGEAIINRNFLEITRYIRYTMPDARIDLLSNFLSLNEDLARAIISENLIDAITVNIDGHDQESYEAVKRINYNTVIENLKNFNKIHLEHNSRIEILVNAMPAWEYDQTVREVLKTEPVNSNNKSVPYSDPKLIEDSLDFLRNNSLVRFKASSPGLWAERRNITTGKAVQPIPNSQLKCPQLKRVQEEAFISPRGDWYPCCLDDNQDISLGNLWKKSLLEIWNSRERQDFIYKLENKQFDEIGYPCNTVFACQTVKLNRFKKSTAIQ